MVLRQSVEHINPLNHISCTTGKVISGGEGKLILDIGKVKENILIKRVLILSNPLSKTLRVKFVDPINQIKFEKNEIIIQPKGGKAENSFQLKAQMREQNSLEFKLYFSETVHYNCCIKYEPTNPSCEFRIDSKPIKNGVGNVENSSLPYSSYVYKDLDLSLIHI